MAVPQTSWGDPPLFFGRRPLFALGYTWPYLPSASAAGKPPSLFKLCDREGMLMELFRRRAGQARRPKRVEPAAEAVIKGASLLLMGDGSAASPALLQVIAVSKAPQTWNHSMGPICHWRAFVEARWQPLLPTEPSLFAKFLAERGGGTLGYSQSPRSTPSKP